MANFELQINEPAFRKIDVVPIFNENLYGELLDEHGPESQRSLSVSLRPYPGWGQSRITRTYLRLRFLNSYGGRGEYHDGNLDVVCNEDLEDTNDSLLHETKHYFDDLTGADVASDAITKNRLIVVGSGAVTAVAAAGLGLYTRTDLNPLLGIYAALPAIPVARHWVYTMAPDEIEARAFSERPEIQEAYGNIISYRQL